MVLSGYGAQKMKMAGKLEIGNVLLPSKVTKMNVNALHGVQMDGISQLARAIKAFGFGKVDSRAFLDC